MNSKNHEITLRDAANQYGVSSDTLRRRIRTGALPHRRMLGRIVVRRADLERVLFDRDDVGVRPTTR